jgi:plastocyanin
MNRTRWMLLVGLLAVALTLAACGGGDDESSSSGSEATATETATPAETATEDSGGGGGGGGGGGETLSLAAPEDGSLKFDKTELDAKAGNVTIDFDNPSSTPHAVTVEGNGIEEKGTKTVTMDKASVTLDLEPGEYEFYCPVGNHRSAGMEGKLTVS